MISFFIKIGNAKIAGRPIVEKRFGPYAHYGDAEAKLKALGWREWTHRVKSDLTPGGSGWIPPFIAGKDSESFACIEEMESDFSEIEAIYHDV